MKDYLMELAKLSGKCLVVFIFAFEKDTSLPKQSSK